MDKVSQYNITNMTNKATLENQYRATSIQLVTTIVQIFGGIAILFGTYFAWGNLTTAKDGTERKIYTGCRSTRESSTRD